MAPVLRALLAGRSRGGASAPAVSQPPPVTPERAIATAVARAAQDLYGLPVYPTEVTPLAATLAELTELLPDQALLAVVEGAGDGLGVIGLAPDLVAALIEFQVTGRVANRTAEPRKPTRTDAIICADFVNAVLQNLAQDPAVLHDFGWRGLWRYASFVDVPRPLALMLEDVGYRLARVTLRLGEGSQSEAQMLIALPAARVVSNPAAQVAQRQDRDDDGFAALLAKKVHAAPVRLSGVLCRRQISLRELRQLAPGKQIALPAGAIHLAKLETARGDLIASGHVGERDGFYALRLSAGADMTDDRSGKATQPPLQAGAVTANDTTDQQPAASSFPDMAEGDIFGPDEFRPQTAADTPGSVEVLPLSPRNS